MLEIESLAQEVNQRLEAAADPARLEFVEGYFPSAMRIVGVTTPDARVIVRDLAPRLKGAPPDDVLELAFRIIGLGTLEGRQVAYELIAKHRGAKKRLDVATLEALGRGNDNWASVDGFSCLLTGPAWRDGQITDATIEAWARSPDRWWRRTALVSTVALSREVQAGDADEARVLRVCSMLVADHEDMVAKALSWALRELAKHDAEAVRGFLETHASRLAARVKREVRNKLETGLKTPRGKEKP